jgi:hypothetical protein
MKKKWIEMNKWMRLMVNLQPKYEEEVREQLFHVKMQVKKMLVKATLIL